jgi:lipoprotein NlpI
MRAMGMRKGRSSWALTLAVQFLVIAACSLFFVTSVRADKQEDARNLVKLADILSDPQDRINYYSQAIELDPNNSLAYHNRGFVYFTLGENQLALNDYNQALALAPQQSWYLNSRGVLYNAMLAPDSALDDLNRAIELNGDINLFYINRGVAEIFLGNFALAEDDFERGVKFGYDRDYALLLTYIERALAGNLAGAQELLTKRADELSSDNWINPIIKLYGGQTDAVEVLAYAQNPDQMFEGRFYLGAWYYFQGDTEDARDCLQETIDGANYDFLEYTIALWMVANLPGMGAEREF